MYSAANRVLDASQEDVPVAEHLKEVGGERTPSRLVSLLLSSPVSAGELLLVFSQLVRRLCTGYAALHTSDEAAEDEDAAAEPGCAALA